MHPSQHSSQKDLNEKQTTNIPPQAIISDDEEYALPPRKNRHAIHQVESTSHQPKLFINDDEEHLLHTKRVKKNHTKKRPHDDLQPKSPHKRKPQRTQDTASSSDITEAQCLFDFPIASYPAMYEYLDKNNFQVRMQLLGATNKAHIRKLSLHLSVKLHPDKDQTNVHATERFASLLSTYSFGYGSRGRCATPVSPVGKCWPWGFWGCGIHFRGCFCAVLGFLASEPLWELGSRLLRVPGVPLSPPCTRRARRARLFFLAFGLSLGTVARRACSACFAGFSLRDRVGQHGGGLAPPRPEGYW